MTHSRTSHHDAGNPNSWTREERLANRETCTVCRLVFRNDGEFRAVTMFPENAEYGQPRAARATTRVSTVRPASEKQIAFARKLWAEKDHGMTDTVLEAALADIKATSGLIDTLLARPRKQAPKAGGAVTEDGMYQNPETKQIFKVQIAKQGSGNLYAKELVLTERDGSKARVSASFEYAPGAIRRLQASWKMTLEQAKEFGQLYGVCCKCGADLTDEGSIAAGIGPICANKGWA